MKKSRTILLENKGSMLLLTLIVFMVILILGTTMITSMLYSQGENKMQINKQKAYYAAQSAADAVKNYFLNPSSSSIRTESIDKPYDLIGTTGTYTLKEQGIDEETTVTLSITREGKISEKDTKEYILIEAVGSCQGEQSKVKVRLVEEKQDGEANLFGSKVVFASSSLQLQNTKITGNIYVDDLNQNWSTHIHNIDMSNPNEDGENTLYMNITSTLTLSESKFKDAYIQFAKQGSTIMGNEAENIYIKYIGEESNEWEKVNFQKNNIKEEAQLYFGNIVPNAYANKIGRRLIFGFDREALLGWTISDNEVDELYIKGLKRLGGDSGGVTGSSSKPTKVLYTDASVSGNLNHINEIVERDLSELNAYEQKITNTINNLQETKEVLEKKPNWDKPDSSSDFIKLESEVGPYAKDPANSDYEEYYDPIRKIRLVFTESDGWHTLKKGEDVNQKGWLTYYISSDPAYKDDQLFFIAKDAQGINFNLNTSDRVDSFYLYAPNAACSFISNFEYFGGSIIAKHITKTYAGPAEIVFKQPEDIDGVGVPGSSSSSNDISYTYSFESYVD